MSLKAGIIGEFKFERFEGFMDLGGITQYGSTVYIGMALVWSAL